MTGIRTNADHWRLRAEQTRQLAEKMAGKAKADMLVVAMAYQKIAEGIDSGLKQTA